MNSYPELKASAEAQHQTRKTVTPIKHRFLALLPHGPSICYCLFCARAAQTVYSLPPKVSRAVALSQVEQVRTFYLCSECERERQSRRSLAWAKEAALFTLSLAITTSYFLTRLPLEAPQMLLTAGLLLIALRGLFIAFNALSAYFQPHSLQAHAQQPLAKGSQLYFDSNTETFQLSAPCNAVVQAFKELDAASQLIEISAPLKSAHYLRQQGLAFTLQSIVIFAWLIMLLSTATELRMYQGTWGSLRLIVDQRLLGEIQPSASETPEATISVYLWPGEHAIQVVGETGAVKTQITRFMQREQRYFLAYLPSERCVSLETLTRKPSGNTLSRSSPPREGNLYILPKIDQWLGPLPSVDTGRGEQKLISQSDIRYALRLTKCR